MQSCEFCASNMEPGDNGGSHKRFCSVKCRTAARRARKRASEGIPPRPEPRVNCEYCNEIMAPGIYGSLKRFCSNKCKIRMRSKTSEYALMRRLYRSKPATKLKEREYAEAYSKRPGVKERSKEVAKIRSQLPSVKARNRELLRNRRLHNAIKCGIYGALREKKNGRTWESMLGYNCEQLAIHLEKQFKRGMTWGNYGKEWHIDHIIPVAHFKLDGFDDPSIKICWGLPNLRPLWATDNLKKQHKRMHLL